MSDVKCARLMYRAAERDVLTLRSMTADAPMESFGFHVQQAAEKAFKAWFALLGEKYPLTHSIETLLDLLDDRGAAVEPFRNLVDYTNRLRQLRAEADAKANRILPALLVCVLGSPANWGSEPRCRPLGDLVAPVSGATPSKTTKRFWSGEVP